VVAIELRISGIIHRILHIDRVKQVEDMRKELDLRFPGPQRQAVRNMQVEKAVIGNLPALRPRSILKRCPAERIP